MFPFCLCRRQMSIASTCHLQFGVRAAVLDQIEDRDRNLVMSDQIFPDNAIRNWTSQVRRRKQPTQSTKRPKDRSRSGNKTGPEFDRYRKSRWEEIIWKTPISDRINRRTGRSLSNVGRRVFVSGLRHVRPFSSLLQNSGFAVVLRSQLTIDFKSCITFSFFLIFYLCYNK